MVKEDTLRLWAYQWVTRGEIPDLPEGVRLYVATGKAPMVQTPIGGFGAVDVETIDLRKFVVESQDSIWTCRAGYGERSKTFVVTSVETHPRYDLVTQEAQP